MDSNTTLVLFFVFATSIFWLPILLNGIASIIRAWRHNGRY
jgi:hypothetical protein